MRTSRLSVKLPLRPQPGPSHTSWIATQITESVSHADQADNIGFTAAIELGRILLETRFTHPVIVVCEFPKHVLKDVITFYI